MGRIARVLAAAGLAVAATGLLAMPAAAHVTVSPASAEQGGYATLTFKVPTERDDASTTKLEVEFPAEQPLASVSTQPKAGWEVEVETEEIDTPLEAEGEDGDEEVTERVSRITWTATEESAQIAPGQFDVFPISAGPLPTDADQIVFKALQTYSDGEVVRWIEEAAAGSTEEPDSPAPTIALVAAADDAGGAPAAPADSAGVDEAKAEAADAKATAIDAQAAAAEAAEDAASASQVNTAVGIAIAAIVLALIAAGIAGVALSRRGDDLYAPSAAGPSAPPPAF